jgi:dephospho-CoA kinase
MNEGKGKRLVIGVAGRIGSGKSEIAHLLEQQLGFQYVRYSLVLAEWKKTDPRAKTQLQHFGWEVMAGSEQFELNRRLISQIDPTGDCVVDGLRHLIDYQSLEDQFPATFRLIYIETPDQLRYERLRFRYTTQEEFAAADSHLVESNIHLLKPHAAVTLAGNLSREDLVAKLTALISNFRLGIQITN